MSTPDETRQDTAITDAVTEDHEPTLASIPAAPRTPAIACGGCDEVFAEAGLGGAALFLAETLRAAAAAAGWTEDGGTWTCTVCQAKTGTAPQPEPQAAAADPPPDTDPYKQYQDVWAEIDKGNDAFWQDVNPSNTAAEERTHDRIRDSYCNIAHLLAADFCDGDPEKEEEIRRGMWDMSAKYQRRADETMRMRAVA